MEDWQRDAHPQLIEVLKKVYLPAGLNIYGFTKEFESQEYGASRFRLNNQRVVFRVAKTTPKKIGQFVTLWKRVDGCIQPFDMADPFDLTVISVRFATHFGQFVFPKDVLHKKGIVSKGGIGGKLATRVYPPWDQVVSKQALKTQKWQIPYFLEINEETDSSSIKTLFSL
ncbi:MAG: hypothetical protein COT84_02830 [Chlamydiae bacterium CG10_big_fil_rev_8_21_14_0_10_35_9]|nr:MAG: hypothetical protein COT84_02830 [Chlamydiae bacterium CG10_big_fil_rev_8_21_14_0_10_35_9]